MKSLFIYEELIPPFDEGMKKFSFKIYQNIENRMDVNAIRDISWLPAPVNSLLIVPRIILANLVARPDVVIFIPKQSLTFFALIKAFIIYLFIGKKLRVVGLQKRVISNLKTKLLKHLKFGKVFVLSHSMKNDLKILNINADVIYTGIDSNRFIPVNDKLTLRKKYGVPENKIIILHVGHIKESRNLELLIEINERFENIQAVIVGSTATKQESGIFEKCTNAGVIVFSENIDDIHELYGLSDVYCFPVVSDNAAMETPLSVLEAMSTNLPVISTQFGQLTELFTEDRHFKYIKDIDDVNIELINNLLKDDCNNRDKVSKFTWNETTNMILST